MKILLTGAAGFIGYHTSKILLERGDEVVGLSNLNDYYDERLKYAVWTSSRPSRGSSSSSSTSATARGMNELFATQSSTG